MAIRSWKARNTHLFTRCSSGIECSFEAMANYSRCYEMRWYGTKRREYIQVVSLFYFLAVELTRTIASSDLRHTVDDCEGYLQLRLVCTAMIIIYEIGRRLTTMDIHLTLDALSIQSHVLPCSAGWTSAWDTTSATRLELTRRA